MYEDSSRAPWNKRPDWWTQLGLAAVGEYMHVSTWKKIKTETRIDDEDDVDGDDDDDKEKEARC